MLKLYCRMSLIAAALAGVGAVVLSLFGALADFNTVFFVILGLGIFALALLAYYSIGSDRRRFDLHGLLYSAYIAVWASLIGIVVDVLMLFELPLLFIAVASAVLVLISLFQFFLLLLRRGD